MKWTPNLSLKKTAFVARNEHLNIKLKTSRFKVHTKTQEFDVSILSWIEHFHQQNKDFTSWSHTIVCLDSYSVCTTTRNQKQQCIKTTWRNVLRYWRIYVSRRNGCSEKNKDKFWFIWQSVRFNHFLNFIISHS